jgi:hypothetical protein
MDKQHLERNTDLCTNMQTYTLISHRNCNSSELLVWERIGSLYIKKGYIIPVIMFFAKINSIGWIFVLMTLAIAQAIHKYYSTFH